MFGSVLQYPTHRDGGTHDSRKHTHTHAGKNIGKQQQFRMCERTIDERSSKADKPAHTIRTNRGMGKRGATEHDLYLCYVSVCAHTHTHIHTHVYITCVSFAVTRAQSVRLPKCGARTKCSNIGVSVYVHTTLYLTYVCVSVCVRAHIACLFVRVRVCVSAYTLHVGLL